MATNPGAYRWGNDSGLDTYNMRTWSDLLQQAGIGEQVFPTGMGGYRGQADQGGALPEGYELGSYDLMPGMPGGYDGAEYMAALRDPQGNIVGEGQYQRGKLNGLDKAIQGMVFSGVGAGVAGGLLGMGAGMAGGATTGAVGGGLNAAADGGNILEGALKGGAFGGLAGYGMEQFAGAPDAMGDYMRTGAAEGSTIGNAYTGAGGQAGAVGANSIAAQMAIPSDFDPSSLFQNVADPTAALQPLPEIGQPPGPMPGMSPGGLGSIPTGEFAPMGNDITQMLQTMQLPEVPTMPWQQLPYEQTVEVSGSPQTNQLPSSLPEMPAPLAPIGPAGAGAAASLTAGLPALPAVPAAVGGGLLSGLPPGVKTAIEVGLPIAGAIAGSQPSGGGTQTRESRMDPRMDPYVFDSFMPEWKKRFDASSGGINDTMRKGWDQQLGLLNDPQIAQQLSGFRNNSLLSTPVAGNPFNGGGMSLSSGGQGLLGQMQYARMPGRLTRG